MSIINKVAKTKNRSISLAVVHISVTFNNTIVTFTDSQGNAIISSSAGSNGFQGARKSTPHAAQVTVSKLSEKAKTFGIRTISISIKGPGSQRESALRAIFQQDFIVTRIEDVTPIAHNGCRPPKKRRV